MAVHIADTINHRETALKKAYLVTSDLDLYGLVLREYSDCQTERFSMDKNVHYILYDCEFYSIRDFLCQTGDGDFELRDSQRGNLLMMRTGNELALNE